jgi:hypothetical protein
VVDPNMPLRGRYLALQLEVTPADGLVNWGMAKLSAEHGQLVARPAIDGQRVTRPRAEWVLGDMVPFFVAEHAVDPRRAGAELWVEVSVPESGPPRAIRLGVKKDGVIREWK